MRWQKISFNLIRDRKLESNVENAAMLNILRENFITHQSPTRL